MDTDDLLAVVRVIESGFNAFDLDVLGRVVAPDVIVHAPVPTDPGLEGWKAALAAVRFGFPDGEIRIEDLYFAAGKVARRWTFLGTHTGSFFGMAPTGRRVEMTGVDIERIEDGRIVEHWSFWDRMALFDQLGLSGPGGDAEGTGAS